jgi:hypothetical protein
VDVVVDGSREVDRKMKFSVSMGHLQARRANLFRTTILNSRFASRNEFLFATPWPCLTSASRHTTYPLIAKMHGFSLVQVVQNS